MKLSKKTITGLAAVMVITTACSNFAFAENNNEGKNTPTDLSIVTSFAADAVLFKCDAEKSYISEDGGKTWEELKATDIDDVATLADEEAVFKYDEKTGKNYISEDGGETWEELKATDIDDVATLVTEDAIFKYDKENDKNYISKDGGKTWEELKATDIDDVAHVDEKASVVDANTLYDACDALVDTESPVADEVLSDDTPVPDEEAVF